MIFNWFFSLQYGSIWIIIPQKVPSYFSPQMRPHEMLNVITEPDVIDRPVFYGVADVNSNLPHNV